MFLVYDLQNNELSYVLPTLAELAKIAKRKGVLEQAIEVNFPEKLFSQPLQNEATKEVSIGESEEDKWRTKGLEVGAVTFNGEERLMLQLLFLMIDLDDTGFITETSIIAWAKEEGKLIRPEHAQRVISAIDYDGDGAIGLRDFFQYAAKLKEEFLSEEGEDEGGDGAAGENTEPVEDEKLLFSNRPKIVVEGDDDDGGFAGVGDASFDPAKAIDITKMHLELESDSPDGFQTSNN